MDGCCAAPAAGRTAPAAGRAAPAAGRCQGAKVVLNERQRRCSSAGSGLVLSGRASVAGARWAPGNIPVVEPPVLVLPQMGSLPFVVKSEPTPLPDMKH